MKSIVLHNTTHKTGATYSQGITKRHPSVLQELYDILLLPITWVQIEIGNWLWPCTQLSILETLIIHLPNSNYSHNPVQFVSLPSYKFQLSRSQLPLPLLRPSLAIKICVLGSSLDSCIDILIPHNLLDWLFSRTKTIFSKFNVSHFYVAMSFL